MIVTLTKNDIEECIEIGHIRKKFDNPKWQRNNYRKGLINNQANPFLAERVGVYGEKAFCKFLNNKVSLNTEKLDDGDDGIDFKLYDALIDVKCQMRVYDSKASFNNEYGHFYINAVNQYGNYRNYKANIFFFTSLHKVVHNGIDLDTQTIRQKGLDVESEYIEIKLHGYILKKDVLKNAKDRIGFTLRKIKNGNMKNYYINKEELKSPERFLRVVKYKSQQEITT